MRAFVLIAAAYLLGSVPFGYLIVRLTAGADVRETGSGGTGATNVSRRAGKAAGILTLVLDAAKGAAAVIIVSWLMKTSPALNWYVALAAVAALVGHCFPLWLGFRGGKRGATGVGIFLVLSPLAVCGAGGPFFSMCRRQPSLSVGCFFAAAAA